MSAAKIGLASARATVAALLEVTPESLGTDLEFCATLGSNTADKYTAEEAWVGLWDDVNLLITNESSYADKAAFIAALQTAIAPYDPT